jgi:hypothetical protein
VRRFRSLTASSFFYLNGNIRTYDGTGTATGAFRAIIKHRNKISLEIQLIGKDDTLFRTKFNTKSAAFAAFSIYLNMTLQ